MDTRGRRALDSDVDSSGSSQALVPRHKAEETYEDSSDEDEVIYLDYRTHRREKKKHRAPRAPPVPPAYGQSINEPYNEDPRHSNYRDPTDYWNPSNYWNPRKSTKDVYSGAHQPGHSVPRRPMESGRTNPVFYEESRTTRRPTDVQDRVMGLGEYPRVSARDLGSAGTSYMYSDSDRLAQPAFQPSRDSAPRTEYPYEEERMKSSSAGKQRESYYYPSDGKRDSSSSSSRDPRRARSYPVEEQQSEGYYPYDEAPNSSPERRRMTSSIDKQRNDPYPSQRMMEPPIDPRGMEYPSERPVSGTFSHRPKTTSERLPDSRPYRGGLPPVDDDPRQPKTVPPPHNPGRSRTTREKAYQPSQDIDPDMEDLPRGIIRVKIAGQWMEIPKEHYKPPEKNLKCVAATVSFEQIMSDKAKRFKKWSGPFSPYPDFIYPTPKPCGDGSHPIEKGSLHRHWYFKEEMMESPSGKCIAKHCFPLPHKEFKDEVKPHESYWDSRETRILNDCAEGWCYPLILKTPHTEGPVDWHSCYCGCGKKVMHDKCVELHCFPKLWLGDQH